jgi:undecaprenyl pyrophosphate phosphatase UppP
VKDVGGAFAGTSGGAYAVGAIAAAVSGFLAVHFLMRYVKEHRMRVFAIYTAVLGGFVIVLSIV